MSPVKHETGSYAGILIGGRRKAGGTNFWKVLRQEHKAIRLENSPCGRGFEFVQTAEDARGLTDVARNGLAPFADSLYHTANALRYIILLVKVQSLLILGAMSSNP